MEKEKGRYIIKSLKSTQNTVSNNSESQNNSSNSSNLDNYILNSNNSKESNSEQNIQKSNFITQALQRTINSQKNIQPDRHPGLSKNLSVEQKAADYIADRIGSWAFLFFFMFILLIWVFVNTLILVNKWDPYPFIFLNLFLSLVAAIQAPIILMAQNRQSQKDRIRMEYDYAVNRKSEREIERLKEQLDRIEKKLI